MSRFSSRKSYWLCLTILALALTASRAGAQYPVQFPAWAGPVSPAWTPADGTSQAQATLGASDTPPVAPYSCSINVGPSWGWGVGNGNVLYSPDNFTWGPASDGYNAWIVVPDPSSPAATFYATFTTGGYWQFPCVASVYYNDLPCGDEWVRVSFCMLNVKAVQLVALTVASGATQQDVTGATNWAAVKTTSGDEVIAQAITKPDNLDAWQQIIWTGGNVIQGNPNRRSVDKSTSAQTTVNAQIGLASFSIDIWILWATIQVLTADPKPIDAPNFAGADDGTEHLGAVDWYTADSTEAAAGKICAVATITPAGVNEVVTAGWKFGRDRMTHDFNDGVKDAKYFDSDWTDDTSLPEYTTLTPDTNDKIYDIDGPNVGEFNNTDSSETYNNFRQYVQWHGDPASEYENWYWQGRWKATEALQITLMDVGTGSITLPNTAYYPPP